MTTIIRNTDVSRPTTTPLKSSILDHARAAGNFKGGIDHFGLRNNAGMWPSYNCLDLLTPTPLCPDPSLDESGEFKSFDAVSWTPAFEFAVHGGVQCKMVGLDKADQKAEVDRVFGLSEGKGIERALRDNRFVARVAPAENPTNLRGLGEWSAPDEITPEQPVNLKQAIALLEGVAAARYVGIPTIHMPRAAVSMISDMVQWRDDDLAYTPAGSKIAVGGGYDDEAMLLSGVWDLWVSGEVYIEATDTSSHQTPVLPGDGSGAGAGQNGLVDNTMITLVERTYRVAVDCFVAHISATIF